MKSIKPANSDSADEPDLIVFNQPGAFAEMHRPTYESIVVIEFKKPMRDDVGRDELPHEHSTGPNGMANSFGTVMISL